ncbi:MAG: VF530 family protein [Nannocystaceae bacterium]
MPAQSNDPLHGVTLAKLLEELVARHGWEQLGARVPIRCFTHEPSLGSSLKFLRKTGWARAQVEAIYLEDQRIIARNAKRNRRRADRRAHRAEHQGLADDETEPASAEDEPSNPGPAPR